MYMTAALGTSPYDAISFILAKKVPHVPFKYVRIAWDTSFLLLGWIAGGNVGPVTFAIAFFLGADIGGRGSTLSVTQKGDMNIWKVENPAGEIQTIEVNKKDANKY